MKCLKWFVIPLLLLAGQLFSANPTIPVNLTGAIGMVNGCWCGAYGIDYDDSRKTDYISIECNEGPLYLFESESPNFFAEVKDAIEKHLAGRKNRTVYYNINYGRISFEYYSRTESDGTILKIISAVTSHFDANNVGW